MGTKIWRHFDFVILLSALLLIGYGMAMIYSATYQPDKPFLVSDLVIRQAIYAGVGLTLLVAMLTIDYRLLGNLAPVAYFLTIGLLGVVLVLGRITHGAQRWIDLGIFPLQPSEMAKLLLIITLAKYMADHEEEMTSKIQYVLISLAIVGVPAGLTFIQPDLGTAVILLIIWIGMAVMVGVRLLHWAGLSLAGVLAAPVLWMGMQGYMRTRLAVFLDPQSDPMGAGYNIIQALTAVGSGGLLGRGFTSGTQSQLHFLRVQYADFIFSVLAEELGFVGACVLFLLIAVLLIRLLKAASLSTETFGRLIATGIVTWLAFQTFINVGMNIRVLPVTGVPLPFISYGGSSLIMILVAIGIIESIVMRHKKIEF
ncbi:MAG: rod shape-determining protein RodA [Dehalococcoidales bacterium]|nr:rod shape-determining protein RodA [Dehalococcoidales bacterium]